MEVDTPVLNTASSGASQHNITRGFSGMWQRLEKNDLDRDFLNMLERKEISSHTRRGHGAELGEYPG